MANYAHAKEIIAANVYTNHDGQVTAEKAKTAINEVVDTLIAGGYLYAGVAKLTPTQTNPGSPDANVFYIATEPGTYTNFVGADGSLVVADGEVAILKFNGTWSKEVTGAATAAQVTELGQYVENPEWVRVVTDANDRILYGVKSDGKFYFGDGCPPQVQDYVNSLLGNKEDKVEGKSLIDAEFAASQSVIDNPEYLQVITDSEGRVLAGILKNGEIVIYGGIVGVASQKYADELKDRLNSIHTRIRVLTTNCGHFNYGDSEISLDTYQQNWRKMLNEAEFDVWGVEEWTQYFDYAAENPHIDARDAVLGNTVQGVLPSNMTDRHTGLFYRGEKYILEGYDNNTVHVSRMINGKNVHFYVAYFPAGDGQTSKNLRRTAAQNIINDINNSNIDYAVIMGDLNAWYESEYDIWKNAGYKVANCGYLGRINTLIRIPPDERPDIPADNIVVTPTINIVKTELLDSFPLNTDHRPLLATLEIL